MVNLLKLFSLLTGIEAAEAISISCFFAAAFLSRDMYASYVSLLVDWCYFDSTDCVFLLLD